MHPSLKIEGITKEKVLRLSLNKSAFDVTGTLEKPFELRNKSKWIESRLFVIKNGLIQKRKTFNYVLFINGYGDNRPWKLIEFKSLGSVNKEVVWKFSNGLIFNQKPGGYIINLGKIIATSESPIN